MNNPEVRFYPGRGTHALALRIAEAYGSELGKLSFFDFSDGEFQPSFDESVRGKTVFLIQSTRPPVENLFELLLMADAARRASAEKVVAVIPYFGWARQDRKDKPRVPIAAKLVANMLCSAGIDRVITMDLHADQIQGFFDIPVDHLYASWLFVPYVEGLHIPNLAFASPDMGGAKRASSYARHFDMPLIVCHKERTRPNQVAEMTAIGDVEGKNVILVDDMIDTAGTITKAANMMVERGAASVRALITHAVLSGPAYERLNASKLQEVVVTDTIPLPDPVPSKKIKVLTVANLFAEVIKRLVSHESISQHYAF